MRSRRGKCTGLAVVSIRYGTVRVTVITVHTYIHTVRVTASRAGISDYDHTRPSRHDRSSRSRSGDREKSQTPESSGRPRMGGVASGRKTPATPAGASTGKKAGAGSKGKSDVK